MNNGPSGPRTLLTIVVSAAHACAISSDAKRQPRNFLIIVFTLRRRLNPSSDLATVLVITFAKFCREIFLFAIDHAESKEQPKQHGGPDEPPGVREEHKRGHD